MPHGDIVSILETGPVVRPKAVEPMGVFDGSDCWGIWLHDRGLGLTEGVEKCEGAHLVISPVLPAIWPFIFRLQLELQHRKGALAAAAKVLKGLGVNIVLTEATPSGFRRATWNVVGEALELEIAFRDELASTSPNHDEVFLEIAKQMLSYLSTLRTKILEANETERFLHEGLANEGFVASFTKEQIGAAVWDAHQDQRANAVSYRTTHNLTYLARCYHAENTRPIRFRYEASRYMFSSPNWQLGLDREFRNGLSFPAWAVVSYNPSELYLRLQPLPKKAVPHVFHINLHYETVDLATALEVPRPSSAGLLHRSSSIIADVDTSLNLVRLSNTISELQDSHEAGHVGYTAWAQGDLETDTALVERRLERLAASAGAEIRVTTRPLSRIKVFVSVNKRKYKNWPRMRSFLYEAAASVGLGEECLVFSDQFTRAVTDNVAKELAETSAFFQLMIKNETPWLLAEYSMALALGLVRVRTFAYLGDEKPFIDWKASRKLDKDHSVLSVDLEDPDNNVIEVFSRGFSEIIRESAERGIL